MVALLVATLIALVVAATGFVLALRIARRYEPGVLFRVGRVRTIHELGALLTRGSTPVGSRPSLRPAEPVRAPGSGPSDSPAPT